MGWSRGFVDGREVGYAVDAVCDVDGCDTEIHRGLAYRCGDIYSDSDGCGAYCCYDHLGIGWCAVCDTEGGR